MEGQQLDNFKVTLESTDYNQTTLKHAHNGRTAIRQL